MNSDTTAIFWRRTSTVLALLLAVAVVTICGLIAVVVWQSMAHEVELRAARAQVEREREISIEMWQATDGALKRAESARSASSPASQAHHVQ